MMPGTDLFLKLSSVAVAHEEEYSAFLVLLKTLTRHILCVRSSLPFVIISWCQFVVCHPVLMQEDFSTDCCDRLTSTHKKI